LRNASLVTGGRNNNFIPLLTKPSHVLMERLVLKVLNVLSITR